MKFTEEPFAKNEKRISTAELSSEIYPLLEEYFTGKIALIGGYITYLLPNNQKFIIKSVEITQ